MKRKRKKKNKIATSKAQEHICKLYNGKLNYCIEFYYADMLLEDNIICEYDGSGHDLLVKTGKMTKKEFHKKECTREKVMISRGYKIFRLVSNNDILPSDEELLRIKDVALEKLKEKPLYIYNLNDKTETLLSFNEIK